MIDGEENSQILEFTNDNVEVIEDYLLLKYGNRDTYMTASYIYVNNVLYVCDSYPLVKIK